VSNRGRVVGFSAAGIVLVALAGTVLFGGPGAGLISPLGISPLMGSSRTDLSLALDDVPREAERVSFTNWALVRESLKADLGQRPDQAAITRFTSKAYNTDFSGVSSINDSAPALEKYFGFSPATMAWEAYAQSGAGAAMVARMPDDFDMGAIAANLKALGYTIPKTSDGVWLGGTDLVAAIDPTITPELQYVAVLADQHLIVTSDTESYAKKTAAVALGQGDSLGSLSSARAVVDPLSEPAAATVWTRDFACTDLAMGQNGNETKAAGDALIARAGKVTPLTGLVMAMGPNRDLGISELFESSTEAAENLRARATLAVGDAPGRGGSFSDTLKLISSKTDGATVQLTMRPKTKTGYVLSALDSGPVVFATC
jgi:hypothetical protein